MSGKGLRSSSGVFPSWTPRGSLPPSGGRPVGLQTTPAPRPSGVSWASCPRLRAVSTSFRGRRNPALAVTRDSSLTSRLIAVQTCSCCGLGLPVSQHIVMAKSVIHLGSPCPMIRGGLSRCEQWVGARRLDLCRLLNLQTLES